MVLLTRPDVERVSRGTTGRWTRIWALFVRYILLLRRDISKAVDVFYWPAIDVVIWGFVTLFIARAGSSIPNFAAMFLGAVILWNVFFRCQQDISVSFLDDVWARGIITLFGSPLSVGEFLVAIMLLGIVKLVLTLGFMMVLALLFYSFNLFSLGLSLLPFVANLIVLGWSIGILSVALILRYGTRVAVLAWSLPFMLQPVSSVFWPESVLPTWLRHIAQFVPSNHVFEGMRTVLLDQRFDWSRFAWSAGTNAVYLALAAAYFVWVFGIARDKGLLTKIRVADSLKCPGH